MTTPDGYMENAQGHLVPLAQVKEIDLARHELVMEKVARALKLQKELGEFKAEVMDDIEAFIALSAEKVRGIRGRQEGQRDPGQL